MSCRIWLSLRKYWLLLGLLFLSLAASSLVAATTLTSSVDRQHIGEDETLNLTITVDDAGFSGDPDLAGLDSNFQILSSNSSSSKAYINGNFSSSKEWHYTLLPKHSGKLLIPSFKLGKLFSDAIEIEVGASAANPGPNENHTGQAAHGDLFLEQHIDKTEAYVQERMTLTLRIFTTIYLDPNSQIPDPVLPGIMVEKLGQTSYQSKREGSNYEVLEYTYGLFANNSGKIVLPKQRYQINQVIHNSQPPSPFDLLGMNQPATRTRVLSTPEITLTIKPQPDNLPADYWLASEDVQLLDNWPKQQTVDVGTPLTRTIEIKALGNLAAHIPPLPALNISGLKSYPEPPTLDNTHTNDNFLATRKETIAIVPIQPGTYHLPAITLHWWDTQNKQFKTSTLPERTLVVRQASGTTAPSGATTPPSSPDTTSGHSSPAASLVMTPSSAVAASSVPAPWYGNSYLWIAAAALFFLLWMVTLIILLKKKSSPATQQTGDKDLRQITLKTAEKELKIACQKNDPSQARTRLIHWAQAMWPDAPLNTLQQIKQHANNDQFSQLLDELDSSLYRENSAWNGKPLSDFMQTAQFSHAQKEDSAKLPGLYS